MRDINRTVSVLVMGVILFLMFGCSAQISQATDPATLHSIPPPYPKKDKALLLVVLAESVQREVTVLVGDNRAGSLSSTELLAVNLIPGTYIVRSSYQNNFPVEVTLQKGEQIIVQAHETDKGLYFKSIPFNEINRVTSGRIVKETDL